jgi:pimeloyl-ACP methyl ester carboxylesterase
MPLSAGIYYFFHDGGKKAWPPMILLPGAGGDHLIWPAEIRRLPEFRVYALDLPGHGKSEGAGRQSAADYARSVLEFMDTVGLWQAVFVGHSMGGAVALTLALEFPERAAGLGLISSGACLPVPPEILENAASSSTFPFAVQELHTLSCGIHTPPRLAEKNLKRLMAVRQTLFYGDLLACDQFDVTERLPFIKIPVLVICGTNDRLTPARYSTTLAARIPGAALQTVDEAGHLVMLEQAQRVAKLLSVFLLTIPNTAGV